MVGAPRRAPPEYKDKIKIIEGNELYASKDSEDLTNLTNEFLKGVPSENIKDIRFIYCGSYNRIIVHYKVIE